MRLVVCTAFRFSKYLWLVGTSVLNFGIKAVAQLEPERAILRPCSQIEIRTESPIQLSESEKVLICGDPDSAPWKNIPTGQAIYFITGFLEQRGYLNIETTISGDHIIIDGGRQVRLEHVDVRFVGDEALNLDVRRYWRPWGSPLTPELLDGIENWVKSELARRGYPCAEVETLASRTTGKVRLIVKPGARWIVGEIESDGIPGLTGGVERRYDAFQAGQIYDSLEFELTSERLMRNDLVLSNTFIPKCAGNDGQRLIEQVTVAGKPRLVSFAFGFDTEELLLFRALWQDGRFTSSGSALKTLASLSWRRQSAEVDFNWYYLPFPSRHYLAFDASIQRKFEERFEERSGTLSLQPSWQIDRSGLSFLFGSGLQFRYFGIPRGAGESQARLLTWDTDLTLLSHNFEFYRSDPRAGYSLELQHSAASRKIGSTVSVQRWNMALTYLRNIAGWEPPIFIFGIRSQFAVNDAQAADLAELPPSYRIFLGGSQDLRGFGRQALPISDFGAASKFYIGSELRLNHVLPYRVQPLIFVDWGWLGKESFGLDFSSTYWSPGFGARWDSPVGSFRATLAHGLIRGGDEDVLGHLSRWQFYLSFGEQF